MKASPGSALLMLLCICTVLVIATTTSWYTACLLHEVACLRQQRFQQQQSTNALLVYGTAIAQQKFDELCKESEPVVLYQGAWPLREDLMGNGYVISHKKNDDVQLVATLEGESKSSSPSCHVKQKSNAAVLLRHDKRDPKMILMVQWSMHEQIG